MTEVDRIRGQLQRSFERRAWHGPAVLEAIDDVTASEASFRPAAHVHSIAELVGHMATWKRVVTERIAGRTFDPTADEDWSPLDPDPAIAWRQARAALDAAHADLARAVAGLADADLDEVTTGSLSRYLLIHGVIQHDLYHAGQILILKRMARGQR